MEEKTRKPKVSGSIGVDLMEEISLDSYTQESLIATIQAEVVKMRLNNIEKQFANGSLINGRNRLETQANKPLLLERDNIENFLSAMDNAASLFKHDTAISYSRPSAGQSIKKLEEVSAMAIKLSQSLQGIDYISEKECTLRGVSLADFPMKLDELIDVIDNRMFESIKQRSGLNKAIQAPRILCKSVIDALLELNVLQLFKTKKGQVQIITQLIYQIQDYIKDEDGSITTADEEYDNKNLYRYINEELPKNQVLNNNKNGFPVRF